MRVPNSFTQGSGDIGGAMTPMIDVVFLLLIYFLCTASFVVADRFLPTTLPPAGATSQAAPKEIQELELIHIALRHHHDQLEIEMNGNSIANLVALRDRLRQVLALANLPA